LGDTDFPTSAPTPPRAKLIGGDDDGDGGDSGGSTGGGSSVGVVVGVLFGLMAVGLLGFFAYRFSDVK
jgi:hypothetical protein